MLRKSPKQYLTSKVFPLFCWLKCEVCEREFTLQYGWKFYVSVPLEASRAHPRIPNGFYWYLCDTCAPSHVKAEETARTIIKRRNDFIKKKRKPRTKPDPPPPPPYEGWNWPAGHMK